MICLLTALIAFILAVVINIYVLEHFFSVDEHIESLSSRYLIYFGQFCFALIGVVLVRFRKSMRVKRLLAWSYGLFVLLLFMGITGLAYYYIQVNSIDIIEEIDLHNIGQGNNSLTCSSKSSSDTDDAIFIHYQCRRPILATYPTQWKKISPGLIASILKMDFSCLKNARAGEKMIDYVMPKIDWAADDGADFSYKMHKQLYILDLVDWWNQIGDIDALVTAKKIVFDWIEKNKLFPAKNMFVWNDDVVSHRLIAHIHLFWALLDCQLLDDKELLLLLESMLRHAIFISQEDNYNKVTNHGLMENCALLSFSAAFPEFKRSSEFITLAVERMVAQIDENVSKDGFHLEGSPGYHLFAIQEFTYFYLLCRQMGIALPVQYEKKLRMMFDNMSKMIFPDGSLPRIGDTEGKSLWQTDGDRNPLEWKVSDEVVSWREYQEFLFVASKGSKGRRPCSRSWVSEASGYFSLGNGFTRFNDRSESIVITGYWGETPRAHKHYGALSFNVFAKGKPIIIDPGYPSYTSIREKIISASAHNALSLDDQENEYGNAEILHYVVFPRNITSDFLTITRFGYISGFEKTYAEVAHLRHLAYLNPSILVIVDNVKLSSDHNFKINFHFFPDIVVEHSDQHFNLFDSPSDKLLGKLRTFVRQNERWIAHTDAVIDKQLMSFRSEYRNVNSIRFLFNRRFLQFISVFDFAGSSFIDLSGNVLTVRDSDHTYHMKMDKENGRPATCEIDGELIVLSNSGDI